MREIKFRAWDGLRMTVSGIAFNNSTGELIATVYNRNGCVEKMPLMQYTGLKDRNGKEIFEGDILNVFDWGNRRPHYLLGVTEVMFCPDQRGWRYENYSLGIEDSYDQFRNVEVIGNIHENPELLEQP